MSVAAKRSAAQEFKHDSIGWDMLTQLANETLDKAEQMGLTEQEVDLLPGRIRHILDDEKEINRNPYRRRKPATKAAGNASR